MEFIVLTAVSVIVVNLLLFLILRKREINPLRNPLVIPAISILEIFCMILGKYGANWKFPWWIYYPIPMFITVFLPPIVFKMNKAETIQYVLLTFLSAPVIHIVFSLFGWNHYMPFIKIPPLFVS